MPDGIGSQGATFQSGQLRSKREKRNRHQAKKKRATTLRHVVAPVIVKLPRGTLTIVQLFARTVGAWNSKKPDFGRRSPGSGERSRCQTPEKVRANT